MFEINEISAAPHLPEPLKSTIHVTRPEACVAFLPMPSKTSEPRSHDARRRNFHRAHGELIQAAAHACPMSASQPSSSRTVTPSARALSSFEPASAPATT